MPYTVRGPKGGLIVRRASLARLKQILPGLRRRFGRVTVTKTPPTEAEVRTRIVRFCWWSIAHEPDWHYAQERPMERLRTPAQLKQLPRDADCSEHATDAYAWANGPDPNGNDFDGTGFTGTMLAHCRRIPLAQVKPGDLAVFGRGSGHHVVVFLEPGTVPDPLLCSHGFERGPIAIRLSAEAAAQPAPVTFLTVFGKDPL